MSLGITPRTVPQDSGNIISIILIRTASSKCTFFFFQGDAKPLTSNGDREINVEGRKRLLGGWMPERRQTSWNFRQYVEDLRNNEEDESFQGNSKSKRKCKKFGHPELGEIWDVQRILKQLRLWSSV